MRDYGIVSPQFWIGATGRLLRGNVNAQIEALYLMTSPHANMIGVYYVTVGSISEETGLPLEGASKALQSLIEARFCDFDADTNEVFVHRMAAFQIGEQLDAKDNRCKGVARELEKVMSDKLRREFHAMYSGAFHLPEMPGVRPKKVSPLKAPPKPRSGTGSGTGNKTPIPEGFAISERVAKWAEEKGFTDVEPQFEAFVSYAKRKGATYADWDEALMTAVRGDWAKVRPAPPAERRLSL